MRQPKGLREIVEEAAGVDAAEDELFGDARGDGLPPEFRSSGELRERLREAKQRLDAKRAAEKKSVPRSRAKRLKEATKRLEQELELERRVAADDRAWRARGISADGRRFGGRDPKPHELPEQPRGKINTTDPDSRNVKTPRSYTQGYNAQGVVNEHQIVLAAEVTVSSPDFGQLQPMVEATNKELEAIGVTDTPGVAVADTGYWHEDQIDNVVSNGTEVLIPPTPANATHPARDGRADATRGCATCWRATTVAGSTEEARRWSSPCSRRPNTTGASTASNDEEDPPRARMAADHRHPQPAQARQAPDSRRSGLRTPPGRDQPRHHPRRTGRCPRRRRLLPGPHL